jgi:hypothetical protein
LANVVPKVREFCADRFSFILIDPYGPKAIPLSVVSQLVHQIQDTIKFAS